MIAKKCIKSYECVKSIFTGIGEKFRFFLDFMVNYAHVLRI